MEDRVRELLCEAVSFKPGWSAADSQSKDDHMNEPDYQPDSIVICGGRVLHPVRDRAEIQAWIEGNGPPTDPEFVRQTIIEMARRRTATTPTEYISTTPAPCG